MATSRPPPIANPTQQAGDPMEGGASAHEVVDVFGDEFAEDYAESVRTLEVINENPFLDDTATPFETPLEEEDNEITNRPLLPDTHSRAGRNSTRKSGHAEEIGIREVGRRLEDGSHAPVPEAQRLMSSARSNRSLSTSSNFSFAPSRSSTGQPSGPSHAYGMYPQGLGTSIGRTESIASTSTSHPSVRRGPLHPYSLYQQNVTASIGRGSAATSLRAPRSEPDEIAQRRIIGDQDSIRPDDHSEQLPAYTRYPDELHTKIAAGPPLTPTSHLSMASEMEERTRFGPYAYGVATGVPAAVYTQSPDDAPDTYVGREKTGHESKKSRFLGATICGSVPIWTVCLAVAVVALIAIICGGVIGSFISKHPKHLHSLGAPTSTTATTVAYSDVIATSTISTTQYIDASPVPTPPSLPALPTGFFQLTFEYPASSANSSACLVDPAQQLAWSCELEMVAPWELQIQQTNAGDMISINGVVDTVELYYGTQPPSLDNELFALVVDLDNVSLGPAYHFQTHYNKLVILPGDTSIGSTPTHNNNKRALDVASGLNKESIPEADTPWFCWFNETLIEGFVYVNQSASTTSSASLTTSTSVYSDSTSSPAAYATTATTMSEEISSVASQAADAPRSTLIPFQSTTYGPPPPPWIAPSTSCTSSLPGAAMPTGLYSHPWKVRRQESSTVLASPTNMPLLFRIEERRAGTTKPAVCTQMASVGPASYAPILVNGVRTTINLTESDPTPTYVTPQARKRDNDQDTCFCMWRT